MQIQMSVGQLRQVMTRALGVTGTKSGSMPILAAVLLEAEQTPGGGVLSAQAYDLEIGLASRVPCEVVKPGALAVPAKLLADVVKALPEATVKLTKEGNNRLVVTSGAATFRLATLPAEDFPKLPTMPKAAVWAPVAQDALVTALGRVTYAMSSDETRYNLNGVAVQPRPEGGLALVCTDGHRMAVAELEGVPDYGLSREGVIVSRKAIAELQALLSEANAEPGDLTFNDNSLLYRRPGLTFVARLIDGQFPDWRQVMPPVSDVPRMDVDYHTLRDALRRVLLVAQDAASPVSLELKPGILTLKARSADLGDAVDQVDVAYVGGEQRIALNGRLLAELVAVDTLPLSVAITDELSPVVAQPVGVTGVRHVLMPMRG